MLLRKVHRPAIAIVEEVKFLRLFIPRALARHIVGKNLVGAFIAPFDLRVHLVLNLFACPHTAPDREQNNAPDFVAVLLPPVADRVLLILAVHSLDDFSVHGISSFRLSLYLLQHRVPGLSTTFPKKLFFIFFLKGVDIPTKVCYYIITARGCEIATKPEGRHSAKTWISKTHKPLPMVDGVIPSTQVKTRGIRQGHLGESYKWQRITTAKRKRTLMRANALPNIRSGIPDLIFFLYIFRTKLYRLQSLAKFGAQQPSASRQIKKGLPFRVRPDRPACFPPRPHPLRGISQRFRHGGRRRSRGCGW